MTRTKQTSYILSRICTSLWMVRVKRGMRREEDLSTNFPKFHGDRATSTMFSQYYRKTYQTDLVFTSHKSGKCIVFQALNSLWTLLGGEQSKPTTEMSPACPKTPFLIFSSSKSGKYSMFEVLTLLWILLGRVWLKLTTEMCSAMENTWELCKIFASILEYQFLTH